MKYILKQIASALFVTALFFSVTACSDMMETDSDHVIFDNENEIKSPDDAFYIVGGILAELQKLGDKYVLMGELRGDLMTTSEFALLSLKEINNFNVLDANDAYLDKRDYYNVINNCNYAIQRMDTSLIIRNEKVMMPAYATIKSVRAWTYLQLALNYGDAIYLENPILDLDASLAQYPVVQLDALVDQLINDLTPYAAVPQPTSQQAQNTFIPVRLLLGDLYLYQNNYAKAATMYHDYMMAETNQQLTVISGYASQWLSDSYKEPYVAVNASHTGSYKNEGIARIYYQNSPGGYHSDMVGLSFSDKPALLPAQNFIDSMAMASYFYLPSGSTMVYAEGDLRGVIKFSKSNSQIGDAYYGGLAYGNQLPYPLIYKFLNTSEYFATGSDPDNKLLKGLYYMINMPVFRQPHLYLRYAEAVNRAGKPSLAFAVLKYGLKKDVLNNVVNSTPKNMVNPSEVATGESYVNFNDSRFNSNIGTASRGRGNGIPEDTKFFVIPNYTRYIDSTDDEGNPIKVPSQDPGDLAAARQDSINWVELRIVDEMAAETAFEGNRFFDLLRVSRHRPNHPEFMADKVSRKYANSAAMKAKLMNMNNWYVK